MVRLGLAFLLLMSSMAAAMAQAAPQAAAAHKPATKAARAQQPTPPAPGGNGRCIGVLSQLGETFAVEKIGIMVFQNAFDDVPIDTWRIDDLVAARISSFIGPRATVRRLSLPRGAIAAIEKERRLFGHEDDITN